MDLMETTTVIIYLEEGYRLVRGCSLDFWPSLGTLLWRTDTPAVPEPWLGDRGWLVPAREKEPVLKLGGSAGRIESRSGFQRMRLERRAALGAKEWGEGQSGALVCMWTAGGATKDDISGGWGFHHWISSSFQSQIGSIWPWEELQAAAWTPWIPPGRGAALVLWRDCRLHSMIHWTSDS